jgi:hypothetical protein
VLPLFARRLDSSLGRCVDGFVYGGVKYMFIRYEGKADTYSGIAVGKKGATTSVFFVVSKAKKVSFLCWFSSAHDFTDCVSLHKCLTYDLISSILFFFSR